MDLGMAGKTFLVVGGSRGMGKATAEVLAEEGANLALVARDTDRLRDAAGEIEGKYGVAVAAVPGDASVPGDMERAVAAATERFGRLDGLAVIAGPMGSYGELHTQDDADWDFYYRNLLMLTVHSCRAVLPALVEQGGGTIVTTGAYSTRAQKPAIAHYTAMKSAIVSVTKNMAKTYGPSGVRANCVCPGMIDTELIPVDREALVDRYSMAEPEALYAYTEEVWGMQLALRRVGQPVEVGELIAFLLSERAAYLTGATINIDGGTDFI